MTFLPSLLLMLLLSSPAAVGADYLVTSPGPHEASRASDGTTELELTVTNTSARDLRLVLRTEDDSCSASTGSPPVLAYSTAEVTFTMSCQSGAASRSAVLTARRADSAGRLVPATIPLEFTVAPAEEPEWSPLWAFLLCGVPLALIGVVPAYRYWARNPRGNKPDEDPSPEPSHAEGSIQVTVFVTPGSASITGESEVVSPWYDRGNLGLVLPGITKDWSFTENWASSAGLVAALFTTVFASTETLEAILPSDATGNIGVVAVAAALAAALIASGPIWLTIWKRRWETQSGIAKHNTVMGVLVASFVVLIGAIGVLFAVAWALGLIGAWAAAVITTVILLVYTWKSIPQTLALGLYAADEEISSAML